MPSKINALLGIGILTGTLFLLFIVVFNIRAVNKHIDQQLDESDLLFVAEETARDQRQAIFRQLDNLQEICSALPPYEGTFILENRSDFSYDDYMTLVRIIGNEAGDVANEVESRCIGRVALNRCRTFEGSFLECVIADTGGYSSREEILSDIIPDYDNAFRTASEVLQGIYPSVCEDLKYFFSPISMAPVDAIHADHETCSYHGSWNNHDRSATHFFDKEENRYYICNRNSGFRYFMSDRGGTMHFTGLGERLIPGFAKDNETCLFESVMGIRPNYYVFCGDEDR